MVVHKPVPLTGLLPANTAVVKQVVWLVPATEGVGLANLVMVTVLSEGVQLPFEIVHLNTFAPTPKLETELLLAVGLLIVATPLTNVQKPLPTVGTFPFKVAVVAHTDWSMPASETVGASSLVTVTVLVEGVQVTLEIVQVKVVVPKGNPKTVALGEFALLKVTPKVVVLQTPVPTVGVLPFKVAVGAQTV